MVSSDSNDITLRSGENIILDTTLGSNPNGRVELTSLTGGVTLNSNAGTINILQSATGATAANINIANSSTAQSGVTGGDIYIHGNSQIILKKLTGGASAAPSIVIDFDGSGEPHTRFVGRSTWQPAGLGTGGQVPVANTAQYNNLTTVLSSANSIFRRTGSTALIDIAPGSWMEQWLGGTQSVSGVDAGIVGVVLGNEGPTEPVTAGFELFDNSLAFGVRGATEDYFSASSNKISFGAPIVLKRSNLLNSTINSNPNSTFSPNSTAPEPINFGWNTKQNDQNFNATAGMPTEFDLTKASFISINVGMGLGYTAPGASLANNNIQYSGVADFPIGQYPGQKLTVKLYVQPVAYTVANKTGGSTAIGNYGSFELRIPVTRTKVGSISPYTSWWHTSLGTLPDGYVPIVISRNFTNATLGRGIFVLIDMIWDGQVITQQGRATDVSQGGVSQITVQNQFGWCILNRSDQETGISGTSFTSCFIAGTIISLSNGDYKFIEEIVIGDEVITYNEKTKLNEAGTVGKLSAHEVLSVIKLTLADNTTVTTTAEHPFFIQGKWVIASELEVGNITKKLDGSDSAITRIDIVKEQHTVYNLLDVSNNHNFYANEILVHNK